jgi:hypothetical protein
MGVDHPILDAKRHSLLLEDVAGVAGGPYRMPPLGTPSTADSPAGCAGHGGVVPARPVPVQSAVVDVVEPGKGPS